MYHLYMLFILIVTLIAYLVYNKYNKLSQFYSGMRSYMNEYIYSILPNKYITDEECLPSNVEEYTDDKVKYIKNPFNKKKLKYND